MAIGLGAALIGGTVGNVVGQAANMGFTAYQNQLDRDFNAEQAQLQREFEERMSSTSYQRAVADMEAAGLNPSVMLAGNGGGSSTPSGASASAAGKTNTIGARFEGLSRKMAMIDAAANTARNVQAAKDAGAGDELKKLQKEAVEVAREEARNAANNPGEGWKDHLGRYTDNNLEAQKNLAAEEYLQWYMNNMR